MWGLIAGLSVDMLSGGPFGAATIALTMVGFVSGVAKGSVFAGHLVFPVVTAFLATALYDLVFLLSVAISGHTVTWADSLFRVILPSAFLNAALTPLFLALMRVLERRLRRQEMEW